jgi:hypothetical protein
MENTIPVNIWDDYYEDGYIPEGEIQNTYMYVENMNIPHIKTMRYLSYLKEWIANNILYLDGVNMFFKFYDSRKKYPNINDPTFHFSRSEIRFEHLTHEKREQLVQDLQNAKLSIDGLDFNIYSES